MLRCGGLNSALSRRERRFAARALIILTMVDIDAIFDDDKSGNVDR